MAIICGDFRLIVMIVASLGVFSVASLKYGHASVDHGTWKLCIGARILINDWRL
ncbi:unnamed protein product [Amaranthus hypochondriacus]